jgi:hypothetical protein
MLLNQEIALKIEFILREPSEWRKMLYGYQ